MYTSFTASKQLIPCQQPSTHVTHSNNESFSRAKDKSWFGADYQAIKSSLGPQGVSSSLHDAVLGIGTVEILVKRRPDARGVQGHGVLRLRNVLHVPSCICNVIGAPVSKDYVLRPATGGICEISDKQGKAAGYFYKLDLPGQLLQLRLSGPPVGPRVGPSPFKSQHMYKICAWWHEDHRQLAMRQLTKRAKKPRASVTTFDNEERAWIKREHGSVWKFMRAFGLKGNCEEDAEKARQIIRSNMAPDTADTLGAISGLGTDVSVGESNALVAQVNKYFGAKELGWIIINYGDVLSFMVSLRLKFCARDGRKAKRVAAILMAPEVEKG
ncbi:hypothetical protein LLEC1_02166 [Akanthomyces lecanii]|uniref:Uncharacterized protein n=1 Tax=Cordyceps confragosa TaxID=2714763 RepID=A0A179IFE5_CORDF|nr:hypothetical protein LLEC1_02166 [Akanthomyces lecanii]